jgi:3-hydroxy acid dehydrogenase / malonic semialdehyde reductase
MTTVLITGASSGFGKATAELLANKGYKLILVARRKELLEEIQSKFTNIYIASVDVRNRDQVKKLFDNLPDEFKGIDVLVSCAGLAAGIDLVYEANLDDWDTMVDTNIKGLLYFTRYALDIMKKRNTGHIVNIGSIAGAVPYKGGSVYGASKAFVKHFSKNLRADLLGTDIKVTNIAPGKSETEFSLVRFKGDPQRSKEEYEGMRSLQPEDIAEAVLWVITQPVRVNIDYIEVLPIDQTYGGMAINRQ